MPAPHPEALRHDVVAVARRGQTPISRIAKDVGFSESCFRRLTGCGAGADARPRGAWRNDFAIAVAFTFPLCLGRRELALRRSVRPTD